MPSQIGPSRTFVVLVSIVLAVAVYIVLWCISVCLLPSHDLMLSLFLLGPAHFLAIRFSVNPPGWVMLICTVLFFLWHPLLFGSLVFGFMGCVKMMCRGSQ